MTAMTMAAASVVWKILINFIVCCFYYFASFTERVCRVISEKLLFVVVGVLSVPVDSVSMVQL
jgi:hypothetical protein